MTEENVKKMTREELEAILELRERENEVLTKKVSEMKKLIVEMNERLKEAIGALEEVRGTAVMLEKAKLD